MTGFEAKYRGRCSDCGEAIEPGDQVVYVNDELVHVDCEGSALAEVVSMRPVETCGTCFLQKPCPCDDGQAAS